MAVGAIQLIVVAACQNVAVTTTTADGGVSTSGTGDGVSTTTTSNSPRPVEAYRLGIFADLTTDNVWALYDTGGASVWNSYVLGATKPSLYTVVYPGINLANDLAADSDPPAGAAEGEGWAIEVGLRSDAMWSDGIAITANDVVFTFETVRDLSLQGRWLTSYPLSDPDDPGIVGIVSVEAIDDHTLKFVFNDRPGLAIWPHAVGLAPVMPAHVWSATVDQAKATDNPLATLEATPGLGLDVSGGPMTLTEWQPGRLARSTSNDNYYNKGRVLDSGGVSTTTGPSPLRPTSLSSMDNKPP